MIRTLSLAPGEEAGMKSYLITILGRIPGEKSREAIVSQVDDPRPQVRLAVLTWQELSEFGP